MGTYPLALSSLSVLPSVFMKSLGLHDDDYFGAQQFHLHYGLIHPSPLSFAYFVTSISAGFGFVLAAILCTRRISTDWSL
jgi:hypothetical protein